MNMLNNSENKQSSIFVVVLPPIQKASLAEVETIKRSDEVGSIQTQPYQVHISHTVGPSQASDRRAFSSSESCCLGKREAKAVGRIN
ncbi:hypothetical protein CEXT_222481 [Caerostris extrusa]|uniref:Uncharacterized protein n=1 Tax=Caerostris extrusa TaxID=172846 RepID=A0AAV4P0F7_CAEEX|nr:hypothetical protein CEXT_222481 [Caerostris extrusa]